MGENRFFEDPFLSSFRERLIKKLSFSFHRSKYQPYDMKLME